VQLAVVRQSSTSGRLVKEESTGIGAISNWLGQEITPWVMPQKLTEIWKLRWSSRIGAGWRVRGPYQRDK